MEDIIREETTFEKASKEYRESADVEKSVARYEKEYGVGYKELQTDVGFWEGSYGGVKQVGISLASLGLTAVSSPSKTALGTGVVIAGTKGLGALPKTLTYGLSGGLAVYGGIKFLDPSSTYLERGAGLVTLAIAGGTLSYGAYKYLRSPVIKTVKIKAPVRSLKTTSAIGKDIKVITEKGSINKVIFENQKLSQTVSAGRRTIVTTKGRLLARSFWKEMGVPKKLITLDSSAIYRGIPTQQLGTKSYYKSLGGLFKVGKESGYQQAFTKLTKYGWTTSQAKSTLRYVAPRVTDQYLRGYLDVKGTVRLANLK